MSNVNKGDHNNNVIWIMDLKSDFPFCSGGNDLLIGQTTTTKSRHVLIYLESSVSDSRFHYNRIKLRLRYACLDNL